MTSAEHTAQFEAYNKAFFLVLNAAPQVASQLRELAHESFEAARQATANEWNLPFLSEEQAASYQPVMIVEPAPAA